MTKITAIANSNIALTKYWGKRNSELILPHNSSTSVTLSGMETTTTIEFSKDYKKDVLILNEKEFSQGSEEFDELTNFMNVLRAKANSSEKAKIVSNNNFPTAAGFASSASGYAALAVAGAKAAGLNLDTKELSILARRGSGSATRSILGGFNEWTKG
ncbi:MAG: diphosphomevalonate decarboxylase, partial [Candidatus Diapherotrites archaeon]|nr:diphosphomevalonate decarboxylase [Candidatus Diapherotrites archaeon]